MMNRFFRITALWLTLLSPAFASQATLVTPGAPLTMTSLASFLNAAFLSIGSCNSGNSAPTNGTGGAAFPSECWINTTSNPWVFSYTADAVHWSEFGSLNTSTFVWTPYSNGFSLALGGNLSTAGALTFSGAFGFTGTLTGATSVTFPTSGTLATLAGFEAPTNKTFVCANQVSCVVRIGTDVSGLGTGVATALAVNVGTAGAPVVNGGALGTPSSGTATNLTGTASGLTAGNVTTNANLTGDVTSSGNATTLTNAPVIAKVLTGFTSGAGTVTAADSILSAIQKVYGNDALKLPLAGGTMSGSIAMGGNAITGVSTITATGANFITLGNIVQSTAGAQLLGVTGASPANYAPFTPQSLTNGTPNATLDYFIFQNHTTGTLYSATASQIASAIGSGVTLFGGVSGAIAIADGMVMNGSTVSPGTSTPLLWQPQSTNCNSGHQVWFIDQNFCSSWDQSFVTDTDPSVTVAIPVTGTAGPTGDLLSLTFTFGAGACASGCAATYTFVAPTITASISGNTMTVTAGSGLLIGQAITGSGVTSTTITGNSLYGTLCSGVACTGTGGTGTYAVANSQTVSSETMTATDTLKSIAWGLSNAIKANSNLFNPSATTTAQQKEIIWSTANTAAAQISLDINGNTPLQITPFGTGTASATPPNTCASSHCALTLDVGPSIQYNRSPGFVPAAGSNIFQNLFTAPATGGSGVYGQMSVGIVNPATSLGSVFLSGQWSSGITAGVYVSQGLYSVSNSDNGADTATFNKYFGQNLSLTGGAVNLTGLVGSAGVRTLCYDNTTGLVTFNNGACGTSDARLKQVTGTIYPSNGLAAIMALKPVDFRWLDAENDKSSGPQIGFLAQDVEKVIPEVVTTNTTSKTITLADGTERTIEDVKSVDYAKIVAPLVAAVQQLKADNDNLQLRLQNLERSAGAR